MDSTNPQSWNRYGYVGNNPLSFIDPSGLLAGKCGSRENLHCGNDPSGANTGNGMGSWNPFEVFTMAFTPTGYAPSGWTLLAITDDGDILVGPDATNAYLDGYTLYVNEIQTFVPVFGNIGLLSTLFQTDSGTQNAANNGPQLIPSHQPTLPKNPYVVPGTQCSKGCHPELPSNARDVFTNCQKVGILATLGGWMAGPWFEGAAGWIAYGGSNAAGTATLLGCF